MREIDGCLKPVLEIPDRRRRGGPMRQVTNLLWIGTARDARGLKEVFDAGIEVLVDLAGEEPAATVVRDLVYLRFPLVDGTGNHPVLLQCAVSAVYGLSAVRPTLVACGAGMSRAPGIAAAVLALRDTRPLAEVLATIPGPLDVSPGLLRDLAACVETMRPWTIDTDEAN